MCTASIFPLRLRVTSYMFFLCMSIVKGPWPEIWSTPTAPGKRSNCRVLQSQVQTTCTHRWPQVAVLIESVPSSGWLEFWCHEMSRQRWRRWRYSPSDLFLANRFRMFGVMTCRLCLAIFGVKPICGALASGDVSFTNPLGGLCWLPGWGPWRVQWVWRDNELVGTACNS